MSWLKRKYEPGLDKAMKRPTLTMGVGIGAFLSAIVTFSFLGQEFLPQLDEGDLTAQVLRVPGTSVDQSQAMQSRIEKELGKLPEVRFVFSKTGTAELASDPMPPNISDTFIIMKPKKEWPDKSLTKADLVAKVEKTLEGIPGGAFEISQPIQMRFNELIAGVRGDVAIKVFGDDFDSMNATANQIAAVLRKTEGAADVRVEQTQGLPMLDIRPNRDAMSRLGITAQTVQDTVSAVIGGRDAGMIFEGDRRFAVTIRLSDAARADLQTLAQVPVPLPNGGFVPLQSVAEIGVTDGPNQISRENGQCARPRCCRRRR
jgi:cobalt-zinc-cadmium resistance protein CzcA